MSEEIKQILVIARHDKTEALRMASGLTLLDDAVSVAVVGTLEDTPANAEQMEALDFADVPVNQGAERDGAAFAASVMNADVVYCL